VLQLASELGLPVNVHSRSAGHYAIDTLMQLGIEKALLHAFDGKLAHALKASLAFIEIGLSGSDQQIAPQGGRGILQ
jgi:Tat protein secretion system quality control protein TatD with DNase activity